MQYQEFAPGRDASGFVECYWGLEGAELILNLGVPFETLERGEWHAQPQCFLVGQITAPLLLRAPAGSHIVGVRLRPGGAAQLLDMPAQELTGRTVPLDELGLKQLAETRDFGAIEKALLQRRRREDPLMDEAVRLLSGSLDVTAVAARLGVSSRQLERRFQARVGISPKLFARIRRFQRVFPAIENNGARWVDAAADCGYYDQAHLIRDFREFAGDPPAALLAGDELARHFLSHFSKTGAQLSR